jgi:CRISPR/Cas system-associated protein endoribonuclease Cas2
MDSYTLKKKKDTGECHLFRGSMTKEGYTSKQISIYEKMDKLESAGNIFACEEEGSARKKCAKTGRKVCSICVSYLYTTY